MLYFLVRALVVFAMTPLLLPAQQVVTSVQNTTGHITTSGLSKPVTLSVDRQTLESVLVNIATQSGLKPVLSGDVRRYAKRISMSVSSVSAASALDRALKGTAIVYQVFPNGSIGFASIQGKSTVVANGAIAGKVTDAKSGKGITGATVSFGTNTKGVITDENGSYRLAGVPSGNLIVTVRLVGYAKQTRVVTVGESATVTVDFKLEPSANVLNEVVVTGTVVATELKAVPSAITVITAKQIEERGITRIDQLFRGDIPGLFALNLGSNALLDEVTMFSRGATAVSPTSAGTASGTNPIKTYIDGIEMADSKYLSQIDPNNIERIEILTGPQASTIYGSNALNGVMQIFTKRGTNRKPQMNVDLVSGVTQNNMSSALAPSHTGDIRLSGIEGRFSYNVGGSVDYIGSWTPAKNTIRYSSSGGGRVQVNRFTADASIRYGVTRNRLGGDKGHNVVALQENGLILLDNTAGIADRRGLSTLNGQTFSLTSVYSPQEWWSHELVVGKDANSVEAIGSVPRYLEPRDTTILFSNTTNAKYSQRYSTILQLPISHLAHTTLTMGVDRWRTRSSNISASSTSFTGLLPNPSVTRDKPQKNAGGFIQSQFALRDALFFTYGLRAEWNPNFGDEAQPNIALRYGIAYSQEVGPVTTKLRASYGRSTRPPTVELKHAISMSKAFGLSDAELLQYGYAPTDFQVANPELGPEFQQGGEGGLELYFGTRGSLVITRYNQTLDGLIEFTYPIDTVRSLVQFPDLGADFYDEEGYGYLGQGQYLNVGSIRNQGWELQGNLNTGPLSTRGTYSWTKSRGIGITPKYRSLFANFSQYQPGATFNYLPEHTWAITTAYSQNATSLSLTVNGNGQLYKTRDKVWYRMRDLGWRDTNSRQRMGMPSSYRSLGHGYAMIHLNAAHKVSSVVEAVMQIQNLTDFYQQDVDIGYATMGRNTKLGLRIVWR